MQIIQKEILSAR